MNCRGLTVVRVVSAAPEPEGVPKAGGIVEAPADVAQLVERHLAKVKVAGSRPVVRSGGGPFRSPLFGSHGGVAEWLRRGSAKPFTPVQFRAPPRRPGIPAPFDNRYGRLAQGESASLTRKRSEVQIL